MGSIARFALVALFLASIPLAARCQNQPQPSPDLERIINASSGTPPTTALRQIDAYVTLHPADGLGFAVRCLLYEETALAQGRDASPAFVDCDKAVQLSPQAPLVYLFVGDAQYDQGRFAESLANYTKAVDLGQTDRGMFWKRCDAYRRLGNLDMALLDCNRQLALTPDSFYALYTRGRLDVARKEYAEALKDLDHALAIHQDVNALYWRGVANLELGNYQSADADFTAGIGLGDRAPDTYFNRAQARVKLGRRSDAAADFQLAATGYRAAGDSARAAAAEAQANAPAASPAPSPSPSASPSGAKFTIDGVVFNATEIIALFGGIHAALDPKDTSIHVNIDVKTGTQMPAYDTDWHYAGSTTNPDATPAITIWILKDIPEARARHAIVAGLLLGLADSGYAGPKWKALYDQVAARDAGQGPNATDPFLYRRRLGDALANFYEDVLRKAP